MREPPRFEHVCLLEDVCDEHREFVSFLAQRLRSGSRCFVLVKQRTELVLVKALAADGLEVAKLQSDKALVCLTILDENTDISTTFSNVLAMIRDEVDSARTAGCRDLLVMIDMSGMPHGAITREDLDDVFLNEPDQCLAFDHVSVFYGFERGSRSSALLLSALTEFPLVAIDGRIEPNPYFDPSSGIVSRGDLDLQLNQKLRYLRGDREAPIEIPFVHETGDRPMFRSFTDNMEEIFLIVDRNLRLVYVNPAAEERWKRRREDLLGRDLWDAFANGIGSFGYEQIQRAATEHKPTQYEILSTVLGHWIEVSVLPHEGGLAIIYRDISERKRIEQALSVQARQQATVATLGRHALESTDLDEFMNEIVESIRETLDVDCVRILESIPDESLLKVVAGAGWNEGVVGEAIVEAGSHTYEGLALSSSEPVIVEDFAREPRFTTPQLLRDHSISSSLSVAIAGQGRPWGLLGAHSRSVVHFTQDDVNFLEAVANTIATAIEHDRAERVQRYYAAIVTSSEDAIIGETLDGIITSWNEAAQRVYGYTADDVLGQPFSMLYPSDRYDEVESILQHVQEGTRIEQYESVRLHKDGRLVDVTITVSPIRDATGRVIGVSKIVRDISAIKLAEIERQANEDRLQLALEAGKMGTWDWNIADGSLSWSSNMERMHGLAAGSFGGKFEDFSRSIHPDDRTRVFAAIERALDGEGDYQVEYRNVRDDGTVQWLEARGRMLQSGTNRSSHLAGICIDVTEQVQARQQIARFAAAAITERDQLQQIIDVIPEGVVITNADGDIQLSNGAARAIWGTSLASIDVLSYALADALPSRDEPWRFEDLPIARSILSGEVVLGEQLMVRDETSGNILQLLVNSAPLKDDRNRVTGAVTTFQDITGLKEFERQKDEFLQTISHDLKNPLASVKGNAQYLRRKARNSSTELMPIVDRIESSTDQAVALIDELLDLTRVQMGRPVDLVRKPTNICQLVRQTV
ncbi:MAG TPA: PAS domain S-box protein, partial [Nitrolancea sp.]|nr:PAS domain S-box protein [Nitrolancea sp.]